MNTVYIITRLSKLKQPEGISDCREDRLCCCLMEDNRLLEVSIDSAGQSILGNIYIGKVKNILKSIDAAFVEIAGKQTCFLPLSEAQMPVLVNRPADGRILAGDEILVQVQKDAVKTKEPVLTATLSLTGRYVCVSLGADNGVRFSHKLSKEDVKQLKERLAAVEVPRGCTLILRTQAPEAQPEALLLEASRLLSQARQLLRMGKTRTVFSLLSQEKPSYLKRLLNGVSPFPEKIVTDELSVYQTLECYYKEKEREENSAPALSFYQDDQLSLAGLYGLKAKLQEATAKNVWLKSGGYLVIEPTEALTVIDVNTGKYAGKKRTEETFLLINQEAALEVARQLRLRNLSGIILVDFINLTDKEAKKELLTRLRSACSQDPVPVRVVDMTPLGLVEITRKKVTRPLAEQLRGLT